MALGFFRRNQKMVMIIMVVLMVSFLIGFQGFQSVFTRSGGSQVIGHTDFDKIRLADQAQAAGDLSILDMLLRQKQQGMAAIEEYNYFHSVPERERPLVYALLLQEAEHYKVRAGDADRDGFLAALGATDDQYANLIENLRSQNISESRFREALGRWLTIHKMFTTSLVLTPPSEEELRYLARNLLEKIDLRVLRFPAEKFLDKVDKAADPNAVQAQFERFRGASPGQYDPNHNPYGFGYIQPQQAEVEYAHIARAVVERAMRPTREQMDRYWSENRGRFFHMTRPATAPATAQAASTATSGPAATSAARPATASAPVTSPSAEPNLVRVAMTPSEAMPEIYRLLAAEQASRKVDELAKRFKALVEASPTGGPDGDAYETARAKMVLRVEADAALDTVVDASRINGLRLDDAMKVLAREANLVAIAFPWGQHGKQSLSADVKVSLDPNIGGRMPLRQALAAVARSVRWPAIQWAMCEGLSGTLFPVAGEGAVDFFPVTVRRTGLLEPAEFRKDEVLGATVAMPLRADVAVMAFTAEKFQRATSGWEPLKEGQEGPVMNVMAGRGGLLQWRLLKAEPARVPTELTDEIREKVEKDLRLMKAMDLAYDAADRIRSVEQFQAADANGDANAVSTGFFARFSQNREGAFVPSLPPALGLPLAASIQSEFMDAAYSLAPRESGEPPALCLVRMPSIKEVFVMRRAGYQPLTREDYQDKYRLLLFQELIQNEIRLSVVRWFDPQIVRMRVGWVSERGGQPSNQPAEEPSEE
jgi:hypothetical protein